MRPFFFGRSERLLFGAHHTPTIRRPRVGAVLLCNPFGQEAIRAHRIYANLAARLSQAGQHVLRFDYYGTGDSAGEVDEGSQEGWIQDVLEAHAELQAASGASHVAWVGLRYGATLAALASQALPRPVAGMVLWDPVTDGAAYLSDLVDAHESFMREDLRGWSPASSPGSESLGFPVGPDLRRAVGQVNLVTGPSPHAREIVVLSTNPAAYAQSFKHAVANWSEAHRWIDVATHSPWNSEKAMNSMVIPVDVLDVIVAQVQAMT